MLTTASISVNQLAEYIVSKSANQRKILTVRKHPDPDFSIGMYHREAAEAVAQYLANGAVDQSPLIKQRQALIQKCHGKIGTVRRINSNVDALDRFLEMLDDVELMGAEPALGEVSPPKLQLHNVEVSVRPEIILRGTGPKKVPCVGALKLHFSTSQPFTAETAGYVSAVVQDWCGKHLASEDEIVNPAYCFVIDVASRCVYPGVKATAQRMKDVAAACQNIAALWPSI